MTSMREAINNNDIATSNMVAGASVAMLGAELVLGKTVFRDAEADFQGGHGSTVRIRVPKSIAPKKFEGSMDAIAQRITEQTVSLTLDTYAANPVDLTAEDMTLNVQDFTTQVVMPQTSALPNTSSRRLPANSRRRSTPRPPLTGHSSSIRPPRATQSLRPGPFWTRPVRPGVLVGLWWTRTSRRCFLMTRTFPRLRTPVIPATHSERPPLGSCTASTS